MPPLYSPALEDIILVSIEKVQKLGIKLTFNSPQDDGLEIVLQNDKWTAQSALDPLSCVLLIEQPMPNYNGDDNIAVATLVKMLDQTSGWIRSFQCGVMGKKNASTSINGYFCGYGIRKKYANDIKQDYIIRI